MIKITPARHFRSTPGVTFDDITVPGSNGLDLVIHDGPSVSPPDRYDLSTPPARIFPQWYVHTHQVDHNRVVQGSRLFELFNPAWHDKHWLVFLTPETGALEIPAGCYHRSYSGKEGSVLINHAIRDDEYDEATEFVPCFLSLVDQFPTNYHGINFYDAQDYIEDGEF